MNATDTIKRLGGIPAVHSIITAAGGSITREAVRQWMRQGDVVPHKWRPVIAEAMKRRKGRKAA